MNKNKKYIFMALMVLILLALCGYFAPFEALFIAVTLIFMVCVFFVVKKILKYNSVFKENALENKMFVYDREKDINSIIPIPFCIINDKEEIINCNLEFQELFNKGEIKEQIKNFLENLDKNLEKQTLNIDGVFFEIHLKSFKKNDDSFYSLCFIDINEKEITKRKIELQKTVAGLAYIDNYEEVMEDIDESQAPLLGAVIEKKIGVYISELGGIFKKFEKDRYIFILSLEALERAKEKKFEILNQVRDLSFGKHTPITLSIGVGISNGSLENSMKNAKDAIELALGRGGDQVLIKDEEKYSFFGGKSSEVSRNARIRARVKADALEAIINDADTVYIMGHKIPDFDSFGAALGMYRIATDLGRKSHIVLDKHSKGIESIYNEIKRDGIYNDMFIGSEKAINLSTENSVLIIVDTHLPSLVESRELLDKIKKVVIFDHHRKGTEYIDNAVLAYNEPYASSTSELVTEIIRYFGEKVDLKNIEADALLAGITVDTKGFGIKAGAITFEAAAFLRRSGADTKRVKYLFKNDFNFVKLKSIIVGSAKIYNGGIIISICPYEQDGGNIVAAQAADELLNIIGIRAAVVLCKMNGTIYVSSRSFGEVNVQVLLEKLGGGGHQTMAGAQFDGITLDEAEEKIKTAIDEYLKEEE